LIGELRTIAFQGEHGAYSELAALRHYGSGIETLPCKSLGDVFRRVVRGEVDAGILPAENSIEGSINQTYDLLLESTLMISAEVKLRISHCLMTLPDTDPRSVRIVYSHPQALAQCNIFLESMKAETVPTYDTAGSAKMLKERSLRDAAAIASERAAEIYGLKIVNRNIEDFPENFTRFFMVGREDAPPTGSDKTSIVFATRHVPGALHSALGELAVRGINLTKIESRPIRTIPWEYHFFADFEGHRLDRRCAEALEALRKTTTYLRVLGSYARAE